MTKVTTKKKLAVLGNGFLAGIIVEAYNKGLLEEYELTGILGRTKEKTEALAEKGGCRPCSTLEELLEDKPDYVAEAASVKAVQDYGMKILSGGADMILLSIGALADETFTERSVNVQKKMEERSTLLPVPSAVLMYCGLFLLWDRHRLLSVPKKDRNPFQEYRCLKKAL